MIDDKKQQPSAGFGTLLTEETIQAIRDLREQLARIVPFNKKGTPWTREQAVQSLEVVANAVGEFMDVKLPENAEGQTIILSHPAKQLFRELAVAIKDLEQGNVDERLQPKEGLGGAAYKANERGNIEEYLQFVKIYQYSKNCSYANAEKQVSQHLEKLGRKIRRKPITAKKLANWRRYPPGRPR
jgi:hypothetical protein